MGSATEPHLEPPEHLSEEMRTWWGSIVATYALEQRHLKVLLAACESWDRMREAGRQLQQSGLVFKDRFGKPKAHPAVAIERDARVGFLRAIRELGLSDGDTPGEARPPRPEGRYLFRP